MKIKIHKINFPYVICLNQECDLETDFAENTDPASDKHLLHLAIAPVFIFEHFLSGNTWGDIFKPTQGYKRGKSNTQAIINNENPRYHYLKFPEKDMPELIIDFKHFFSINRNILYANLDKRICSLDALFKEKISQRFSYYLSRIGLPEVEEPV